MNNVINAETTYLGQCLMYENATPKGIIAGIDVNWFGDSFHATLWHKICEASTSGMKIDLAWAIDTMGKQYTMRLSELVGEVLTDSTAMTHIATMRHNYQRRQLANNINNLQTRMWTENPTPLIREIIDGLNQVLNINEKPDEGVSERVRKLLASKLEVSTGCKTLDYMTFGIEPATFWVVGGDTSHGKSSWATNIALVVAKQNVPITYISSEMRDDQFFTRLITMTTGIKKQITGMKDEELELATQKYEELAKLPIEFLYTTSLSHIRLTIQRQKSKVYFIDHLQDIHPDRQIKDRREEVSYVARALEEISKENRVCIIATSKFRRPAGKTSPTIHSFKETGEIEYSADIAGLLRYEWAMCNRFDKDEMEKMKKSGNENLLQLSIVKNRIHGRTGIIALHFNREKLLIKEITKDEEKP